MASNLATKARPAPAKAPAKPAAAAKKAAAKAAPKQAAETVTLRAILEQIAEGLEMPKNRAHAIAAEMVAAVTETLKAGDRVRLTGLGILEVKDRPARRGRNPATGEIVQIAASRKVAFRVAKELKDAV